MGVLMIENDGIVFLFDSGNKIEIKFEEIISVVHYLKFPKSAKRPLITLKDGRKFVFCINPGSNIGGAMLSLSGHQLAGLGSQLDQSRRIKEGNKEVFNILNYKKGGWFKTAQKWQKKITEKKHNTYIHMSVRMGQ